RQSASGGIYGRASLATMPAPRARTPVSLHGGGRPGEQHRHEDAEWKRSPIREREAGVAEEEHQQPRRRKCRDEENDHHDEKRPHAELPFCVRVLGASTTPSCETIGLLR